MKIDPAIFLNSYLIYWHRFWIDFDQILDYRFFWFFGIPVFRTLFEKIDPTWLLRANRYAEKNPIWILFISGFHQKVSKIFVFTNQIPLFHDNPVFSVRPSETSSGRFLCFQSDSYFSELLKKINILFGAFLVIYMSNKFPNPSRKMRLEELVWWISF